MKILFTVCCMLILSSGAFAQAKATATPTKQDSTKTKTAPAKPASTKPAVKAITATPAKQDSTKGKPVPARPTTTAPVKATSATTAKTDTTKARTAPAKPNTTAPVKATAAKTDSTKAKPATAVKAIPAKPKAIEWADLDLTTANPPLAVILKAPKGSTTEYDNGIVIWGADSAYGVVIDMSYGDPPASIAERKKEAVENIMFKLEKFIVDKPDMLLYSVKNRDKLEYHFEIAVQAHGEKYYLHDKWLDSKSFTQKEIEAMMESAKGLRAK